MFCYQERFEVEPPLGCKECKTALAIKCIFQSQWWPVNGLHHFCFNPYVHVLYFAPMARRATKSIMGTQVQCGSHGNRNLQWKTKYRTGYLLPYRAVKKKVYGFKNVSLPLQFAAITFFSSKCNQSNRLHTHHHIKKKNSRMNLLISAENIFMQSMCKLAVMWKCV